MPVKFKIDILAALKGAGYTTYRIRKEKLLAEATLQNIRKGCLPSWENIGRLCELLQCQPGDILEYAPADGVESKQDTASASETAL